MSSPPSLLALLYFSTLISWSASKISLSSEEESSLYWREVPKENDVLFNEASEDGSRGGHPSNRAFWSTFRPSESCSAQIQEISEFRNKLNHVKQTLLDGIDCGEGNCTHISILSTGHSALRQAPRFGVYTLHALHDGFPVYVRHASEQYLFYKEDYDKWAYSHRIERWIVGPQIGDSEGGLMFISDHKCPWEIDFTYKDRAYYFDKMVYNIWNPHGNGWKSEERIQIKCFYPERYPNPSFCCSVLNITSVDRVLQYHSEKIGIYRKVARPDKLNFQLPVYKMEGSEQYLYSHHPLGRLWLMGSSYSSWSLRLNLIHNKHLNSYYCPEEPLVRNSRWEYLYSTNNDGDQVWLKDEGFKIECLEY